MIVVHLHKTENCIETFSLKEREFTISAWLSDFSEKLLFVFWLELADIALEEVILLWGRNRAYKLFVIVGIDRSICLKLLIPDNKT